MEKTFAILAFSVLLFAKPLQSLAINTPSKLLVDYQLRYSYSRDSLMAFWKKNNMPRFVLPVRNGVDMYEVTYKGMWLDSSFIIAKGVLYVPQTDKPAAEMVYCHGTRVSLNQSYGIQDLEQVVCMMHAADGYVAMFPFYYGFAGGEKEHVYQDVPTEALSTIYMIKACRELYTELGTKTSGQLFLTGYSQGGHASLATHKMIESSFPEIQLTASSPMSGAYDMAGVQSVIMNQHYDRPHYLPYLILSYNYAYGLWPGEVLNVFKPEYRDLIRKVFAQPRIVDYGRIDDMLPKYPCDMLVDEVYEKYLTDTTFAFTRKLRENGLTGWTPKAPVQLCACYGDNEVLYQNTEVAYRSLSTGSSKVYKRVFGKHLSHNPCAPFAILHSKFFFNNTRKGRKHPERFTGGQKFILSVAIGMANKQAKRTLEKTGKIEEDAMASRKKKK